MNKRITVGIFIILTVSFGVIAGLTSLSSHSSFGTIGQGEQASGVQGTIGPADDETQEDESSSNTENIGDCISSFISQGSSVEEAVEQCGVGEDEQEQEEAAVDEQGESQPILPLEEQEDSVQEPVSPCPEGTVLSRSEGGGAECVQPPVSPCPEGTVLSTAKGGGECVQPRLEGDASIKKAPVAISGSNVYVAWWTNEISNNDEEVMFRASTNGGRTFSERINLSNTTGADSERVEIDSDDDGVTVTWWETNQTDDIPVMRISNDNGASFGPIRSLAMNGTIGEPSDGEENPDDQSFS